MTACVLDLIEFESPHSGFRIAVDLLRVLMDCGIVERVGFILTDNGCNMICLFKEAKMITEKQANEDLHRQRRHEIADAEGSCSSDFRQIIRIDEDNQNTETVFDLLPDSIEQTPAALLSADDEFYEDNPIQEENELEQSQNNIRSEPEYISQIPSSDEALISNINDISNFKGIVTTDELMAELDEFNDEETNTNTRLNSKRLKRFKNFSKFCENTFGQIY